MNPITSSLAAVLAAIPNANASASGVLSTQLENILGTSLDMKIAAQTFALAENAEAHVLTEISRLQQILGSTGSHNEFARWMKSSKGEAVVVSAEISEVLNLFDDWNARTNGAINAASEEVARHWKDGDVDVNEAHWALGEGTAMRLTDAELRLHTFTKGYVMEKAAAVAMASPGVNGLVLNVGGDILVKGDWTEPVRVSDPRLDAENGASLGVVSLANKSIATSGNYRRGEALDGQWFSHIMDPRTGKPAQDVISATVIHSDAVTAGALATAFNVLSVAESKDLAANYQDLEYLIVTKNGEQIASESWSGASPETSISMVNLKEKFWAANQELLINIQVADLGGGARRPYVAVWVEDSNHKPVRRLALWYRKPRWLPDLRSFSEAQRESPIDLMSITSATRSAGNYSLVWDGKNDQGQFVEQGNYTIYIEAAREHGTYQLMKQSMKFDGKAKTQAIAGNEELSSASLVYRTK
jgi:thiamine biosynthesis lipoprotein ApbE